MGRKGRQGAQQEIASVMATKDRKFIKDTFRKLNAEWSKN